MASKKDLVEAHAYNRRRLVTAFTSGAPGGREAEPSRPGRMLAVGVVLGVLVVGAGALTGAVKPTVKQGWDDRSLVVAKKSGARYLALNGTLYPVLNTASARLIIPPEDFKVVFAPEDRIAQAPQGPARGIPGAPESVPLPRDLLGEKVGSWTSCVQWADDPKVYLKEARTSLRISRTSTADPVPANEALLATVGGATKLLFGTGGYDVASEAVARLNMNPLNAIPLPAAWVNQFTQGQLPIGPIKRIGDGKPITTDGYPLRVDDGDLVSVKGGLDYLATRGGAVELTKLQAEMYDLGAFGQPGYRRQAVVRPPTAFAKTAPAQIVNTRAAWPPAVPRAQFDPVRFTVGCVIMTTSDFAGPLTTLARPRKGFLLPKVGGNVSVDGGAGALVTVNRSTPLTLVDSLGRRNPLQSADEKVALGYAGVAPQFVLDSWLQALQLGAVLDRRQLVGRQ